MLGISQNRFEENRCFLGDFYSALLEGCSVAIINCGKEICGPSLLSRLNMEEDRRGTGGSLISVIQVEYAVFFCEEVELNRVALSTFTISDIIKVGVSLCI